MVEPSKRKLTFEILDPHRLEKAVDSFTYKSGKKIYDAGEVVVDNIGLQNAYCTVHDRHPYPVEIKVSGNYLYLKCECRFGDRGKICKHEIAACLATREALRQRAPAPWKSQFRDLIALNQGVSARPHTPTQYLLIFSLQGISQHSPFSPWKINPVKIPLNELSKSLREQLISVQGHRLDELLIANPEIGEKSRMYFQKLDPGGCLNCEQDAVLLANVLIERERTHRFSRQNISLNDQLALITSRGYPLFIGNWENPCIEPIQVINSPASVALSLAIEGGQLTLHAQILVGNTHIPFWVNSDDPYEKGIKIISSNPLWLLNQGLLFKIDDPDLVAYCNYFFETPEITVPKNSIESFRNKYYLALAEKFQISGDMVTSESIDCAPIPRLYLDEEGGEISAHIRFLYGENEVSYSKVAQSETILQRAHTWHLIRIRRKPDLEKKLFIQAGSSKYGLKQTPRLKTPGSLSLRARKHPVDFLLNDVPKLVQDGFDVFGEERLTIARVNRNKPTISFRIVSGIDWFDLKAIINFGEIKVDFKEIRKILKNNRRYVKLSDGTIGEIPEDWFAHYRLLFGLGEQGSDHIRLGRHHLAMLDQVVGKNEYVETDQQYIIERDRLRGFTGIVKMDLPTQFIGELRAYQKAGYEWLHFLHQYSFGGCLADDMGLGKTIQALVFLQSVKEGIHLQSENAEIISTTRQTSLLVVPRSLLVNWQREAKRFTPQLRVLEFFNGDRETEFEAFDCADLVITTYGILRRDIKFLQNYRFYCVLLDESQAIKNPLSVTAKAVRRLNCDHRFSLTGTPIENSTLELWSLFAFLNPGMLGSLDYFKREFISPIEHDRDQEKVELLRKMIHPFVLRRTKDQVAPELPPRSERILYTDMHPAQRQLYNRTRNYYRSVLLGLVEDGQISANRMKILEGLLRLRQISNHPRLVDEKFRGESGKFDLLMETLETLSAEGHKALIFSQFVKMLGIVQEGLKGRGIPYEYLDGKTKDRQVRVDRFQIDPEIPLFLISLRAGGLGLNLTAADYVIHIDPWWNPAVELQATDRSHRIGQDKPVFVYKLITRDSVEEKVLVLQKRKKEIVNQIITKDVSFLKSITAEDLQMLFSD